MKINRDKLKQQPWGFYSALSVLPSLYLFGSLGIVVFILLMCIALFYGEDCEDR